MSVPYERVLVHEVALGHSRVEMCAPCLTAIPNYECRLPWCPCVCNAAHYDPTATLSTRPRWIEPSHPMQVTQTAPRRTRPAPAPVALSYKGHVTQQTHVALALVMGLIMGSGLGVVASAPGIEGTARSVALALGICTTLIASAIVIRREK